jgi:hypothetical protein
MSELNGDTLLHDPNTGHYYARKGYMYSCPDCAFFILCKGRGKGTPAEGLSKKTGCGCAEWQVWTDIGEDPKKSGL